MTLTPGQRRWLDSTVTDARTGVVDGRVRDVVVQNDVKVVHVVGSAGSSAQMRLPVDVDVEVGESASVRVDGRITDWEPDGDESARLHVVGDNGEFFETVTPPRTVAEQDEHNKRRAREEKAAADARAVEDAKRAEQEAAARAARENRISSLRTKAAKSTDPAAVRDVLSALLDEVFGPAPSPDPEPTTPTDPTPPSPPPLSPR